MQLLREGSAFFNASSYQIDGVSLWLRACTMSGMLDSPKILQVLIEAGVKTTDVDSRGWNCLFRCVLGSRFPSCSAEFEALQYLLTVFDDIFACETAKPYCDLFDWVHHFTFHQPSELGSYKEDLWYCALYRSELALRVEIPPPLVPPVFNSRYTVQHYRALLYFDTWDIRCWHRHLRYLPLLNGDAIGHREQEGALSLGEWVPLHLLMMEERVGRAIYEADDDDDEETEEDDDDEDSEEDDDDEDSEKAEEDQDDGEGDDEDGDQDDFP